MEFGRLVSRAGEISWHCKTLWIFGMVVGLIGFIPNMVTVEGSGNLSTGSDYLPMLSGFGFIGLMSIVILLSMTAGTISQGALIDSVNRIERGGLYRFSEAVSSGMNFFWRLLGLSIIIFVPSAAAAAGAFLVIVMMFGVGMGTGILSLLIIVPLGLLIALAVFMIAELAAVIIVVRNASIGDALEEAYLLFTRNKVNSVVMALVNLGLALAFAVIALIIGVLIGLPMAAIMAAGGTREIVLKTEPFLVGMPIWIILSGFFTALMVSFYTLFYFELVEPKYSTALEMPPPA